MERQTAFPGIIVRAIQAKSGEGGKTLEFEEGLPEDIPTERIQSFLDSVTMFDSELVDSELTYNLQVAAVNPSVAKGKARTFARLKNPFEPSMVDVSKPEQLKMIGVFDGLRKAYKVDVNIQK